MSPQLVHQYTQNLPHKVFMGLSLQCPHFTMEGENRDKSEKVELLFSDHIAIFSY